MLTDAYGYEYEYVNADAEAAARRQALRAIRMHIRKILAKIRRLLQQAAHMTSREFYNNLAYMSQYRPGQYMPPN
jgi:hypothetical protein